MLDLVDRLRADGDAAIALVAAEHGRIIGQILFSPVRAPFRALALAPVAVLPGRQRQGIGSALIESGLARATTAGWEGVFVVGEPAFYRRFGFEPELAAGFLAAAGSAAATGSGLLFSLFSAFSSDLSRSP